MLAHFISFLVLFAPVAGSRHATAPIPSGPRPSSSTMRLMTTETTTAAEPCCSYDQSAPLAENFYLYWSVLSTDRVRFAMQFDDETRSAAIGFSNTEYMIGSTAVVGSCVGGELAINSYNINGKELDEVVETTTDLGSPFCEVDDSGKVFIHFSVPVETKDYVVALDGGQYFIYALGSDSTGFSLWTWGTTGVVSLNLVTGQLERLVPGLDMVDAHACLMTLGFGVFMTIGAIVGRFGRLLLNYKVCGIAAWKLLFRPMQILGLMMVIPGLFVAVGMVEDKGNAHLASTHAKYGLALLVLCTFQVIGGFAAPREQVGRPMSKTKVGWITFHRALAVFVVFCGFFNMYLGIGRLEQWSGWEGEYDSSRSVVLATMAGIAFFWLVLEALVLWVSNSIPAIVDGKTARGQAGNIKSTPKFIIKDAKESSHQQEAKSPEINIPEGAVRLRQLDTGMIVHLTEEYA